MSHPANDLDEVVHQRNRLGILTIVGEADRVEFSFITATLALTAGNLAGHLTVLANAGLITIEKGYQGRRPRTWVTITKKGRKALAAEVAALRRLVALVERSQPPRSRPNPMNSTRSRPARTAEGSV